MFIGHIIISEILLNVPNKPSHNFFNASTGFVNNSFIHSTAAFIVSKIPLIIPLSKSVKLNDSSHTFAFSNPNLPAIHAIPFFNKSRGIPIKLPIILLNPPSRPPRIPSSLNPSMNPVMKSKTPIIRVIGQNIFPNILPNPAANFTMPEAILDIPTAALPIFAIDRKTFTSGLKILPINAIPSLTTLPTRAIIPGNLLPLTVAEIDLNIFEIPCTAFAITLFLPKKFLRGARALPNTLPNPLASFAVSLPNDLKNDRRKTNGAAIRAIATPIAAIIFLNPPPFSISISISVPVGSAFSIIPSPVLDASGPSIASTIVVSNAVCFFNSSREASASPAILSRGITSAGAPSAPAPPSPPLPPHILSQPFP